MCLTSNRMNGTESNRVALRLTRMDRENARIRRTSTGSSNQPIDTEEQTEVLDRASDDLSLETLIHEFQVDTGIEDLAAQHDHYLYGTPKR